MTSNKLVRMPDLPYTNKHGVVFNKRKVDSILRFGSNCLKKYFKANPAESGVELTEALVYTLDNVTIEAAAKTLFYKALYSKMITEYNKEQRHKKRFALTDKVIDFAAGSPHPLQESIEVQQFVMSVDKELASIIKLLVQGYSYREIAAIEGISKSEVGNRVKEIRQQWIYLYGTEKENS